MYGPLGDPGSYGAAMSDTPEAKFTPVDWEDAFASLDSRGNSSMSFGSDPWLNTMDRIDRERYEGEAEARDYYLNRQRAGTVWDKPRGIQMPTLSAPRPVDTQGSLGNYQWNRPAPTARYGSPKNVGNPFGYR
tara:strand:- start:197 stop:595 length:399 start_codon:yes stop_codon:yes gene_type:complete